MERKKAVIKPDQTTANRCVPAKKLSVREGSVW